jgi:hypothetical protein
VGGTGANQNELVMPTLSFVTSPGLHTNSTDYTFEKNEPGGVWDGTFNIKWTKNLTTWKRSMYVTFTYGNQTASNGSAQGVGPLQLTASSPYNATGVTAGTFTVKAANGEGSAVTGWDLTCSDTWVTDLTGASAIRLLDNDASKDNRTSGTITVTKDDATGTLASVTQKGYSLSLTSSGTAVTVKDDSGNNITSGYTVSVSGGDSMGSYSVSGAVITVSGTSGQTYTVTVTHTASTASASTSVTIP